MDSSRTGRVAMPDAGQRTRSDHPLTTATTRRYGPDSQLRDPQQFVRDSRASFRGSWAISRRLLLRDLRSRYRQSALGYVWLVAPPLATTLVWQYLAAAKIVNVGTTRVPFVIYALAGTMFWQSFVDALNNPIQQLTGAANLLSKMAFPAESLFIAGLGSVILNSTIRLVLLVPVLAWYRIFPGWSGLAAPFGMLLIVNFGFGLGLVLAPFAALYRDITHGLSVVTMFWFLVTPIVYTTPVDGIGKWLAILNPMAPLVNVARDWTTGGPVQPSLAWVVANVLGFVLMAGGWVLLRLSMPHLVDRIGT